MAQESSRYHRISVALHWLVGLAILAQLSLGFWMEGVPKSPPGVRAGWFNLHKSTGMLIAVFILFRVIWRLTHRPPEWSGLLMPWQRALANLNHRLLYLCMMVMPLSGFLGSTFTPYPIKFFGMTLPRFWGPWPEMKEIMAVIHFSTAFILASIVALHCLAALYHAFKKDGVMSRMMFSRSPSEPSAATQSLSEPQSPS